MPRSHDALVNPELLLWARESAGYTVEHAADKLHVKVVQLMSWEAGEDLPTVKQLKSIANVYKQPFAAFYLPVAPPVFRPPQRDLRTVYGHTPSALNPDITLETRFVLERREIYLELKESLGEEVSPFPLTVDRQVPPKELAEQFRQLLGITDKLQLSWRDDRVSFNSWRSRIEAAGVLVFQTRMIPVHEMRGSSSYFPVCPVILLNRKEAYLGRLFTLVHELAHIALRTRAICDPPPDEVDSPVQYDIERYCDAVAANAIAPDNIIAQQVAELDITPSKIAFSDVENLSRVIGASRQVILRRLSELGCISPTKYRDFQNSLRKLLASQATASESKQVPPHIDRVSLVGKTVIRTVISAFNAEKITASDVSDYLGLKAKHFGKLDAALATD